MKRKYTIYSLSARSVSSYAKKEPEGSFSFSLDRSATERCKVYSAVHEQDDCALFHQLQCVLHGDGYTASGESTVCSDLSTVLFYMDFAGIFDRNERKTLAALRQQKAEAMFRPEGIALDFGDGPQPYVAFERSASMSRQARLSFIRRDLYEPVRQRIMLDLTVGVCQLSKLYAYNGLMLSGGTRIDGIGIDKPHRVIVVENNEFSKSARVITVEDCGGTESVRKYRRVEKVDSITVTEFDGEGLLSKEYAKVIDKAYCGKQIHSSFQIRLPYVKGMLHAVDFKDFFLSAGVKEIKDIWGIFHPVGDVDIVLTKSMFKGYGWLTENGKTWQDYWEAFRKYDHALYITNVSKEKPERTTQLNYQFLNTVAMTAEEFRPADLPNGWTESPELDSRHWITKETETLFYKLCADADYRREHFLRPLQYRGADKHSRVYQLGYILKLNPAFIGERVYADELSAQAEKVLRDYSLGRLYVAGDNRFLSGDVLRLLSLLTLKNSSRRNAKELRILSAVASQSFEDGAFYAPKAAYASGEYCTLLRNPHISRNEEIQLRPYTKAENMRKYYLGHLTDVVMVDTAQYAAERLGGADFDGDMVKTIADPVLNVCVQRNYEGLSADRKDTNIPFLKIPAAEPVLRDANDWHDRFVIVRDTFSSRVGQISNAALDRSIIAYDENSDAADRERCREETEILGILTGLEIDSAKSGVKPDLSEYLGRAKRQRNVFLQYKYLAEKGDGRSAWYEPTTREKLDAFIQNTDWSKVSSNVEQLPYLAYMLRKHTPRLREKPASDEELFTFAAEPDWKDRLDPAKLELMGTIIREYNACLTRIRISKAPIKNRPRRTDIDRILYSRGQEELYSSDELYAVFSAMAPERIAELRTLLREQAWHLMTAEERTSFLRDNLPGEILSAYKELLSDFRLGGYRILGDLICDIDEENRNLERKQLHREGDSEQMTAMLTAYDNKAASESYREAAARGCRAYLEKQIKPTLAVRYAVALGKRDFLWDVLPDKVAENVRRIK